MGKFRLPYSVRDVPWAESLCQDAKGTSSFESFNRCSVHAYGKAHHRACCLIASALLRIDSLGSCAHIRFR